MEFSERVEMILQGLREQGRVTVTALARQSGCSEMTIRRDLAHLERDGLLRRVHGGAVSTLAGEAIPFGTRSHQHLDAKRRIATAAAGLLDDGETLVLDSGTTTLELATLLADRPVTVLPLSLHAAWALAGGGRARLVLPGGDLRPGELTMVGPLAEQALDRLRVDTFVLSCCGITTADGVTAYDLAEAQVKRAALTAARRVIAVTDSSKFGRTAFGRVCPVDTVHTLVTDTDAPQDEITRLRDAGVEVHLV
ncbi:MAG TPA: DeoR/GlpR family DNA-binding transcription regulator [Pseudonocardiaceae bacterium]